MTQRDGFVRRQRTLEDQYFQQRELELIAKLRRRAEEAAGRQRLADRTGIEDQEILYDLEQLGYTADTVLLLHLVPLIQVAWADGSVSDSERHLIIAAARARGIDEGTSADRRLNGWLTIQPPREVFDKTLRAIIAILHAHPLERQSTEHDLLTYCSAVAEVSGGLLGFGRVSDGERRLLAHITAELERSHESAAERAIASITEPS